MRCQAPGPPQCEHCKGRATPQRADQGHRHPQFITGGYLATYAFDARQFAHPATLLASGAAEMRERMAQRLAEPDLHARLLQRVVMGNIVIDHEEVRRTFPEGAGRVDMVVIYEVADGKIASATAHVTNKRMDAPA